MAAFFSSLNRTIVAGIVIVLVMIGVAGTFQSFGQMAYWQFFMRWLHILSGVMWIGLLWYFNFVQTPSMPKIPDEQKPAIGKVIAPTALFWFRWGAMSTLITGALLAKSDFLNLGAVALFGTVTLACYARIVPLLFAAGERLQAYIALAQVLVLAAAAAGFFTGGR